MSEHDDLQQAIEHLNASKNGFQWDDHDVASPEDEHFDVLCFTNHGHRYAFLGEDVREVIGKTTLTPLPGSPVYIEGVMIHRRHVIGVLNLNMWLYPDQHWAQEDQDRIILVEQGSFSAGIHAGQRAHIEQWPQSSLEHPGMDILSTRVKAYCLGVQEDEEQQAILLLNIRKILEDAAIRG